MEKGPSVAVRAARPAATASHSADSGLSFRITSKQTKTPFILGEFRPEIKPVAEGPARTFNFKDTVPFVVPTLGLPQRKDTKPAPTRVRYGEFKPQPLVTTDTKVDPYYPEKFVDFTVPNVKKDDKKTVKENPQYWHYPSPDKSKTPQKDETKPVVETQQITALRTELQQIVTKTKPQPVVETEVQTQPELAPTTDNNAEAFQENLGVRKPIAIVRVEQLGKKVQKMRDKVLFIFPYKKEEKEKKRAVKYVKDKFAIAARKSRALIATTWLYAEKVYNTRGMYHNLERYTVSGQELAGQMGAHSTDVVSGLAKKVGAHDNTLDLIANRVQQMPETESVAEAVSYIEKAVDENPAVDMKNVNDAQGEEVARPSDVMRVLAEALLP